MWAIPEGSRQRRLKAVGSLAKEPMLWVLRKQGFLPGLFIRYCHRKGSERWPGLRGRDPGQLCTQVASDKGAREPPCTMGAGGAEQFLSRERGEVSGEMKQGRGNERLSASRP